MFDRLPDMLGGWHVVYVAFFATFLTEAGFPLPVVPSGVQLFTGYQFALGNYLLAGATLGTSIVGSLTGALLIYALSLRLGRPVMLRFWRFLRLREEWSAKAETRLTRLDALSIAQVRMVPGLALPASIVAGAGRARLLAFAAAVMASELIWRIPYLTIGYLAGVSTADLSDLAAWVPAVLGGLAVIFGLVRVAWVLAPAVATRGRRMKKRIALQRPGDPMTGG